jgi:DNA-binding CsgD family transcriptional regulator
MGAHPAGYLVLTNIPEGEWSFPIGPEKSVIGRSSTADIVINARYHSVSRRHAAVWADRRGLWISDLGSSSGTNINGVWVDHVPKAGVVVGDAIWLGEVELEVRGEIDDLASGFPHMLDEVPTKLRQFVPLARTMAQQLSPAEIDVMLWISRGFQDDEEIARQLHRSPNTVRTEIGNIFRKFGLHSRAELMGWLKRANRSRLAAGKQKPTSAEQGPRLRGAESKSRKWFR